MCPTGFSRVLVGRICVNWQHDKWKARRLRQLYTKTDWFVCFGCGRQSVTAKIINTKVYLFIRLFSKNVQIKRICVNTSNINLGSEEAVLSFIRLSSRFCCSIQKHSNYIPNLKALNSLRSQDFFLFLFRCFSSCRYVQFYTETYVE